MLRRYLIVNGVSSAVLCGGIWAFVPSLTSLSQVINETWDDVMGHTFLGPVLHRMITVGANIIGVG